MGIVKVSERLQLEWLEPLDASFILRLVNDPDWIRFIGDRGIRELEGAQEYILSGPMESYRKNGFGLNKVSLREGKVPIGMCGLVKREGLEEVDIGFAFLAEFRGRGYALEAAKAVLAHAHEELRLERVVAITDPENVPSQRLLKKLGMQNQGLIQLPGIEGESLLFAP